MSVCKFNSEYYESIEIGVNLYQVTDVPYHLQKVLYKYKKNLRIKIKQNGSSYTKVFLLATIYSIFEGNNNSIKALLTDNDFHQRLKSIILMELVNGAALIYSVFSADIP